MTDDEAMTLGARGAFVALVFTGSLAQAQQPGPYLQQPHPPQQYPQQQYPQQYPQQQYPQQQYPPPFGPSSPPSAESLEPAGFGYALVFAGGGGFTEVDQGPAWRTTAGGLFFHGSASGFANHTSARLRVSGFFGGGGGGFETAAALQAFIGLGAPVSRGSQLFVRMGSSAYVLKNDEIEASATQLPAVQVGVDFHTKGIGFEVSPQAGLAPRTEYEPGDEDQGRRYWRRIGTRGSVGGLATVYSDYFFLDGSFSRVLDSDPLTLLEGDVCIVPYVFAVCAFGQYWRSLANAPTPLAPRLTVPTTYFGFSVGFGVAGSAARKFDGPPKM
jgi:hypothetical protein